MSWGGLKAQSLCIKRVNILPSSCGFKDVPLSQLLIPCSTSTGKDSSACWFIKSHHYTSNPHFENICNPADTTSELDFQTRCGICTVAPFPHDHPDCWEWETGVFLSLKTDELHWTSQLPKTQYLMATIMVVSAALYCCCSLWAKENEVPVFQMEEVVIMVESVLSHLFLSDILSCIIPLSSPITWVWS